MSRFEERLTGFTKILYYKDDDHFIIRLNSNDNTGYILFVKGMNTYSNFVDLIAKMNELIRLGGKEKTVPAYAWQYEFNEMDDFAVPDVKFNIGANYKSIEKQNFSSTGKNFVITKAFQRTSLVLDENGATVGSEAKVFSASDSVTVRPKHIIFDKPFFIIMKETGKQNPFFAMKVQNFELLTKF